MSRGLRVHGHTRSGADDESRTRGPDPHGTWRGRALPTELHPQKVQGMPPASTGAALRQLVKERPPQAVVRSIDRWLAPIRKPVEVENERGPDPFGVRASAYRAWKVAELSQFSTSFSRLHLILLLREPAERRGMAAGGARTLGALKSAGALRGNPEADAHERTQTPHGSVCVDDVAWFHGGCLGWNLVGNRSRPEGLDSTWGGL
jgi:hypothetical protein